MVIMADVEKGSNNGQAEKSIMKTLPESDTDVSSKRLRQIQDIMANIENGSNHVKAEKSIVKTLPGSDTDVAVTKRRHQSLLLGIVLLLMKCRCQILLLGSVLVLPLIVIAIAVPLTIMRDTTITTSGEREGKDNITFTGKLYLQLRQQQKT